MKIAPDLDDVIAEFFESLLDYHHKKTGRRYRKEDFPEWEWWPLLAPTREEAIKFVDEFHETHKVEEIKPLKDAIE